MEERLDDAINILRNHAEGPGIQPVPPTTLNEISPVTAHSNGLIASQSYPGVAIISLDPHVVSFLKFLFCHHWYLLKCFKCCIDDDFFANIIVCIFVNKCLSYEDVVLLVSSVEL